MHYTLRMARTYKPIIWREAKCLTVSGGIPPGTEAPKNEALYGVPAGAPPRQPPDRSRHAFSLILHDFSHVNTRIQATTTIKNTHFTLTLHRIFPLQSNIRRNQSSHMCLKWFLCEVTKLAPSYPPSCVFLTFVSSILTVFDFFGEISSSLWRVKNSKQSLNNVYASESVH